MQKKQKLSNIHSIGINLPSLLTYALMTCALVFSGCAQQQGRQVAGPVYVPDSCGKAETLELAEEVLVKMHFSIEKADIESGLIRTRPLSGAQFFELWREDNVGTDNALLANMHTIRRTVEIGIAQQGKQFRIGCEVTVQRLSLPERRTASSARAYEMYSRSTPSLQQLRFDPEQEEGMTWIDLGPDTQLAAEILKRIEEQITHRAGSETPMTGSSS